MLRIRSGARLFDPLGDPLRNRYGLDPRRIVDHAAGAGAPAPGERHVAAPDLEAVGHRSQALPDYLEMDLQLVAEAGRRRVLAGDRHPRPGELAAVRLPPVDLGPQGPEKGVLGVLHEDEEAGEVDDAAHVGVDVLDFPAGSDLVHGPYGIWSHDLTPTPLLPWKSGHKGR